MKRYQQKEYLENRYWEHNRSIDQIAKEEGVDKGTVFYWMKKLDVKRRTDSEALMIHHPNRIKLPEMNEDLAYVLGVIFGDGCMCVRLSNPPIHQPLSFDIRIASLAEVNVV